jgi:hypothetical protein
MKKNFLAHIFDTNNLALGLLGDSEFLSFLYIKIITTKAAKVYSILLGAIVVSNPTLNLDVPYLFHPEFPLLGVVYH